MHRDDSFDDLLKSPRPRMVKSFGDRSIAQVSQFSKQGRVSRLSAVKGREVTKKKSTSFNVSKLKVIAKAVFPFYTKNSLNLIKYSSAALEGSLHESLSVFDNQGAGGAFVPSSENCICLMENMVLQNLFGPIPPIEFASEVYLKTNSKSGKLTTTGTLVLDHGKLCFKKPQDEEPCLEIFTYDLKSIKYPSQENKVFGFSAYKRDTVPLANGHHTVKVIRVAVQCASTTTAKQWVMSLLAEMERLSDSIQKCLANMLDVYKVTDFQNIPFPHIECLLKKRVLFCEISKLPNSQKRHEANFFLGEFLLDMQRNSTADKYLAQVQSFLKDQSQKKTSIIDLISTVETTDALTILKKELKLLRLSIPPESDGAVLQTT